MKKLTKTAALIAALGLLAGCAGESAAPAASAPASPSPTQEAAQASQPAQVATSADMAAVEDVVEEGMAPVTAQSLVDGTYPVAVDSSSSMFKIASCELTVADGAMTAVMTMGGTGYLYLYMGTGEQAAAASEEEYIPFVENAAGEHTFTVPVPALDAGVDCAAFSKKKEMWYDRTLLFRVDSLPLEAFQAGVITAPEDLGLADGTYQVDVRLEGGSGKASVQSPAKLQVKDGAMTATIVMSSSNYDYMKVDGVRYDPVTLEGGSTFEIPVTGFDWNMPIVADTVAMSTPHEVEYTLYFDSTTVVPAP